MRYSDLCIDLESLSDGKSSQKGFYHNGIWNSVIYQRNEVLRERSEILVMKGNSIFMDIRDDKIRLPGGSTERDISIIETAVKECQEEAKITPSNVKYYGYYTELFRNGKRTPKWILESHFPVTYTGYLTHVCVGRYMEKYTGYIKPEDQDNLNVDAKWVPMDKAKKYLNDVQRKAIDKYLKEEKYSNLSIDLEGTLFTDRREERMELLKQRKCLVVITTSRNKSGGIRTKSYETRYGFKGSARVLMRSEEDMTCTDPELLRIINPIYESHKTGWMDEKLFAALDAYSRKTNKLVVIIYDWPPIYKFNMVQSRPTVVVNSSMIATGIGEVIGEGHKLSDVINKYKSHSQLKTRIPKNLYVANPESLRLYHVSPAKLTELKPRVTTKPMDKENFGIARISAAPTVDGCFRGVGAKASGRYQVYRLLLTRDSRVVKPTTKLVPDRDNSDEYWVLTATKVKNIGYVDVTVNEDGSKSFDDHVHE